MPFLKIQWIRNEPGMGTFGSLDPTVDENSTFILQGNKYKCEAIIKRCIAYMAHSHYNDFDR